MLCIVYFVFDFFVLIIIKVFSLFFWLVLVVMYVAPHHHVLLSFPCFSLLGTIVSRCHVLFLFLAAKHNCSSSPFVIVHRHYALLIFPSLLCIVLATPFVVVRFYYCSSSQYVNVVFHHCAFLFFSSFMCVAIVALRWHGLLLLFLVIMCYCSPYFYWYVSLSCTKYLSNLLLFLNSSLLCYYCSPSSSLWFSSFNLILPITFAFVQVREETWNFKLNVFQDELLYYFFVYLSFICMYVLYVFFEHVCVWIFFVVCVLYVNNFKFVVCV